MQVKEIMSRNVQMVSPETSLSEVARKMQLRDCGSILVAKNDRLMGVITDRDLVLRCMVEGHDPGKINAEKVMTSRILYCRDTDDVQTVVLDMTKNKVRRLPVLDQDKRLVGIVSLGDLAVNTTEHDVCGKALGHICAVPGQLAEVVSNQNDSHKIQPISI